MKYEIVLFTTFPSFLFKQGRIKSRNFDGKNQYTIQRVLLQRDMSFIRWMMSN